MPEVDEEALAKAWNELAKLLQSRSIEERKRLVKTAIVFFEIPIGRPPKAHGGQDDCG